MKVEFHPAADSELRAAAKYYNDRVSGLGAEFLAEVEKPAYGWVSTRRSDRDSMRIIVGLL